MKINVGNLFSISEAKQNFSKVARLVDEKGTAIILKNNAPRYVLLDYSLFCQNTIADDVDVDTAASRILTKHMKAFQELALNKEQIKRLHKKLLDVTAGLVLT